APVAETAPSRRFCTGWVVEGRGSGCGKWILAKPTKENESASSLVKSLWLSRDDLQHLVQAVNQEIGVVLGKTHRRLDAQHVAAEPGLAEEQAPLLPQFEHVGRLARGRLLGLAVADQFDAEHQTQAAHLA